MRIPKGYVTANFVVDRLRISYRTLMRWDKEKQKKIKSIKPGKERFYLLSDLERLENGR